MSGTIDLSQLPPVVVEPLDFETLFNERKEAFIALYPEDEQDVIRRTLSLESEPITMLLEENCYRELLLRQRVNEAARAVMVAYSVGSDLDQLAANFNVERLTITPEDDSVVPPVPAVMESDADLRVRTPQAFEGLSVAGPTAAYEFSACLLMGALLMCLPSVQRLPASLSLYFPARVTALPARGVDRYRCQCAEWRRGAPGCRSRDRAGGGDRAL